MSATSTATSQPSTHAHLTLEEQNQLIAEHLPLVGYNVTSALRRVPAHIRRDELASAGSFALVQAARTYNPALGVPFPRYATARIKGAITDELRSMDWVTRGARQRARRVEELTDRLTSELGHPPTRDHLAEALGIKVTDIRSYRDAAHRTVVPLDNPSTSAESIADKGLSPEDHALLQERLRYLVAGVSALPPALQTVIEGLFFQDRTPADIATELNVTVSRISQLRSQALTLLRDAMNTALDPDQAPRPSPTPGTAEKRRLAYYAAVADRAQTAHTQHIAHQRATKDDASSKATAC